MPTGAYKRTEEMNKNMSKVKKGKIPYIMTEEIKAKMSKANKGKHFSPKTEFEKGQIVPEETRIKMSAYHQGIRVEDWDGYKERQKRNDGAYKQWRLGVYKKDNYKCKINNKDCSGRIIAHHILGWSEYPELRYKINNGITLCQAHHPRKRAEEKRLVPFLQELVSVSSR